MNPSPNVYQAGIGVFTADQGNTWVQTVLNYPQLRTFTGLDSMAVLVLGAAASNDGGQGHYYYVSTGVYTDNNSTTIVPTGAVQGAWLRLTGI